MPTLSPIDFLDDLLSQLEARKVRIREYLNQHVRTGSKRDFTEADIEKINERIEETAAAINGVREYKAKKAGKKSYTPVMTTVQA